MFCLCACKMASTNACFVLRSRPPTCLLTPKCSLSTNMRNSTTDFDINALCLISFGVKGLGGGGFAGESTLPINSTAIITAVKVQKKVTSRA
mmetsp:Transcript_2823/g.6337  ORF Transcript_2823/g.6337 Transcript_2823/m.6337 type:complete len:92 (+) Transcript_2823:90-365(+)